MQSFPLDKVFLVDSFLFSPELDLTNLFNKYFSYTPIDFDWILYKEPDQIEPINIFWEWFDPYFRSALMFEENMLMYYGQSYESIQKMPIWKRKGYIDFRQKMLSE